MQEISNSEKHIQPFQKAIYLCHYPRRHETVEGERKRRGTERKVMRQDFSTTRTKTELKASPRPRSSSERSEENSTKNGRRSSELREESSSRKPEIALPRQGSSGALIYRIFQAAVFEKCRIPRKESEARSFQRLLPSLPFGGLFSIFPGRGIFRRKSHGGA